MEFDSTVVDVDAVGAVFVITNKNARCIAGGAEKLDTVFAGAGDGEQGFQDLKVLSLVEDDVRSGAVAVEIAVVEINIAPVSAG